MAGNGNPFVSFRHVQLSKLVIESSESFERRECCADVESRNQSAVMAFRFRINLVVFVNELGNDEGDVTDMVSRIHTRCKMVSVPDEGDSP